jgi:hypothetical protein
MVEGVSSEKTLDKIFNEYHKNFEFDKIFKTVDPR